MVLKFLKVQINFKVEDYDGGGGYINSTSLDVIDFERKLSSDRIEFLKKLKTCIKNIDENTFNFNNIKIHKSFSNEVYEIYFNVN